MADPADPLSLFSPYAAGWFRAAFGAPTPPQAQGWPVIARGDHALIISPTGSGKTLTAFLWSLDALFRELGTAGQGPDVARDKPLKGSELHGSGAPSTVGGGSNPLPRHRPRRGARH